MRSGSQLLGRAVAALPAGLRGLRRTGVGPASGRDRRAAIFMLHRVLPARTPCYDPAMAVSTASFEVFLDWVSAFFRPVPLSELAACLERGSPGANKPWCALTFDDGWLDTFTHAAAAMQRRQIPFTVFLPLRFIGSERRFWQERLWWQLRHPGSEEAIGARLERAAAGMPWCGRLTEADREFSALRARLVRRASAEAEAFVECLENSEGAAPAMAGRAFMNWEQVAQLQAAGGEFGAHTLNHELLRCAPPRVAEQELRHSRHELSERLGTAVRSLSYPWGGLSPLTLAQAAAAGYSLAVTTRPGWARAQQDQLLWPRIAVSEALLQGGEGPRWISLARARCARVPRPAARRRLRVAVLLDNPEYWDQFQNQELLGGSELQLLRQVEALGPEYFEPELYLFRPGPLPLGWRWPTHSLPADCRGRWRRVRAMQRLLRKQRPDLAVAMFMESMFLGVPAAWLARVPAILCARRNLGYWKQWQHRAALPVINRMATAWQVNAPAIAEMLQRRERIPERALEILPNWIDLSRFSPASPARRAEARRELQLDADLIAVCVANHRPVKSLQTLVRAAAVAGPGLEQSGISMQVVLVGNDVSELADEVRAQHAAPWLRLAGPSDRVERYLQAADIGVLGSFSEGCSNAVLEYMAVGLPLILSDIPANRSLAEESFFPPGNAEALAEQLVQWAHDPARRARAGERNRRRVARFGESAFGLRVQAHYLRAAGAVLRR